MTNQPKLVFSELSFLVLLQHNLKLKVNNFVQI